MAKLNLIEIVQIDVFGPGTERRFKRTAYDWEIQQVMESIERGFNMTATEVYLNGENYMGTAGRLFFHL